MSLRESIKSLSGNKRKFLLLRIVDFNTEVALKMVGVAKGTYNSWLQSDDFVALYRQRDDFNANSKQEAIQLLRQENQLAAVFLEGQILAKMKEELESGEYDLMRTNLAREVYSKLVSDLGVAPKIQIGTWEQRIANILAPLPQQLLSPVIGELSETPIADSLIEGEILSEVAPVQES